MKDQQSDLVDLSVELDPRIHFSMQQNDVPVVKVLRVENRSDRPLRDLEIRISAEPDFAEGWSAHIAAVGGQSVYHLDAVDLQLSPGFLSKLTECVRGQLRGEVWCDSERLAEWSCPVELLAHDEWGGLSSLPEILAAFVLPNHPAVSQVLRSAADVLSHWTGDPSLSGYQTKDPGRVFRTAAAVYAALQNLDITYVNPPAGFEDQGQRVRLPDKILDSRMATCLDITLLATGCLEQAGLNPLVVMVKGHAFVAVWLTDECFPEAVVLDGLRLSKRVELSELAVFDPTSVTSPHRVPFETAVTEAGRRLDSADQFVCAIDVRRARKGRIRPLPELSVGATNGEVSRVSASVSTEPLPPDVSGIAPPNSSDGARSTSPPTGETPATRLDRWRRKLLDLTLRNRLLNYRDTKKTLQLLCPDLGQLEDLLAGGATFAVMPRPDDLAEHDPRNAAAHQRRTGDEGLDEVLLEELKAKRLRTDTSPEELDRRLIEIYRAARLGLEEGGASALYLAVGFLSWYETENTDHRRLAPILLLPLELHRKSVREGFTLRMGDDEPRINTTLLELLKQDFGLTIPGLDPLPEDESGLCVAKILRTVRQAVRDIDRWSVLDEAQIGLFSFTKFLMWRDLNERADSFLKNQVVKHLVETPDQPFDPDASLPQPDRLDQERAPTDTYCPLPADSSQLAAVFAAAEGRSFVLEGPPGTGKSQTITNLIAHCLTEGKTVLFVSEKMAALDVVHRRLRNNGLGRYCLELHSNKAHKREIIAQLEASLDRLERYSEDEWERLARRLAELRSDLNAYVGALHQKRSTGETVFQATSRLIGLRDVRRVDLQWPGPDALDADRLVALRDLVDRLATAGEPCGRIPGHPWEAAGRGDWTAGWEEVVRRAVGELHDACESLAPRATACSRRLGLGENGWSLDGLTLMHQLALRLMDSPGPPIEILVGPDWDTTRDQIDRWIDLGQTRDRLRQKVAEDFRPEIVGLDLDDLCTRLEQASTSVWPFSWWRRLPVRKALKSVAIGGTTPPNAELAAPIDTALALRDAQRGLAAASDEARKTLGRHWKDGEAEWKGIAQIRDWAGDVRALAVKTTGDAFERGAELRELWGRLATEGRELLRPEGSIGRELVTYGEALETFKQKRNQLVELLDLDVEPVWGTGSSPDAFGRIRSSTTIWQAAFPRLRNWCAWRRARTEAMRHNLAQLVGDFEQGRIAVSELSQVFERSYTEWWLTAVSDREPLLSQFFSPEHERKIDQFRAVDEQYLELTRQLIQARLAGRVPATSSTVLPNSEMGILRREVGKRRRHMAVRKLLHEIPTLLPRLKPCLLMSPMSVAQYLDADYPPFDVVVFDEASQIPVWDAVGAIARGRQAVIVGDPKQLPPTSFFQRADDEDGAAEDDVVEDLESVLDECISAQIPWLSLDWHYRSRHESLIAFSNYHYYKNRLLTFPSPSLRGLGVKWRHIPGGVYDKGKTRTNRAEADAVVAEILRRLHDPELGRFSIGVVTFNQAQQTLIEDLLDAARAGDTSLDEHFAEEALEPVFIKNLENVQGDERDVILFSICYGPDMSGRVSMNFGPMNRDGGERRLNVAVTRARREVVVFSTLKADQIDLNRTRARGVRDLKGFLEYADRGASAIADAIKPNPDADFDSPFEEAVFDALVQRGRVVHKQVGCARYRIDLAVVDPEAQGRYLLGIECDGANYHRAKTARDRDKLREGVLRDLGWTLHRIWSTNWWTDADTEISRIEAALERAKKEPRTVEPVQAPKAKTPTLPLMSVVDPAPHEPDPYRPTATDEVLGSQADFYESAAVVAIRKRVREVVQQEGPISLSLATRRVAACWDFGRVTSKAIDRVRRLIPTDDVFVQSTEAGEFLWPGELEPASYTSFRVPDGNGDGARQATDLPLEEIGNAIVHVLEHNMGAPQDELAREVARIFGFDRLGPVVAERMHSAINALLDRGIAGSKSGTVTLAGMCCNFQKEAGE